MPPSEYAAAGVDYAKIAPFKQRMIEVGKQTLSLPRRRNVEVSQAPHGALFWYTGDQRRHSWCTVIEGLGNKNWIAEWMYRFGPHKRSYYDAIGVDTALMPVNDVIAQGAMPVAFTDYVAAGDDRWFEDPIRSADLARGFLNICAEVGMALPAGESPALRYLIKAYPPVASAPELCGAVVGIITKTPIKGQDLTIGDHILGAPSSGLHANGISLVIRRAMLLKEQFLTKLPNGRTLGEEALIPTRSYVALVEALLQDDVEILAMVPGTGGGVAKVAFDDRPFTYRIKQWVPVPPIFQFFRELGVSIKDCLETFNWGIGYYVFVPPQEVDRAIRVAHRAGYELTDLGLVEEGPRQVIFEPENIILPPPGH